MSQPSLKHLVLGHHQGPVQTSWLKRLSVGLGIVTALGMAPSLAHALALGKLQALSHMGERLNVEVDVAEISPAELSGLKASIGSPEMFQGAGIEFNPGLLGAEVNLQKRPDGRYFFKVTSSNPINDPFVNLVVVINWSTGRIVRDYALLLDPPAALKAPPAVTTAPTLTTPAAPPSPVSQPTADTSATMAAKAAKADAAQPQKGGNKKGEANAAKSDPSGSGQVKVAQGMTAGEIAGNNRPEGVSLDQMLVALLKANPKAFINGNVNLLKAGAVLSLPSESDAAAVSKSQAKQTISAQSADFGDYKRKLAGLAPANATDSDKRQSAGQVETRVTEKKPEAVAKDKLLLSNSAKDTKANEAVLAKELQKKEDAKRLETLSKNIKDLNQQLAASSAGASVGKAGAGAAASATNPTKAPGVDVTTKAPAIAPPVVAASAVATQTASAASADLPASQAIANTPKLPKPAVVAGPSFPEEPSFLDDLMGNPLTIPIGLGVLALIGAAAWYRQKQRKQSEGTNSAFFESRMQSDSFFGVSGGQQIDTQDAPPSSNNSYTASQLNAAADVDPIAEADVYLAYGRDIQAEEILKDAMAAQPTRLAIPLKLLEIYAKKPDSKAFDKLSAKVKTLTNGTGPEWERARELAKTMASGSGAAKAPEPVMTTSLEAPSVFPEPVKSNIPVLNEPAATEGQMFTGEGAKSVSYEMDLDFSSGMDATNSGKKSNSAPALSTFSASPVVSASSPKGPSGSPEIIDFDLSALSLDLNSAMPSPNDVKAGGNSNSDPWATKLALAKEFQSIGDADSARKMVQEVINGGSDALKAEAKKFLSTLA